MISSNLIYRVTVNADSIQLYNNEDVPFGVWLSPFITERRDITLGNMPKCWLQYNQQLTSHKQTIEDMHKKCENPGTNVRVHVN